MKPSFSVYSQRRGFALVVTLSLMVLLTIIAVGLLSLSSISIRSSARGMDQAQARANARLALQLAIGDLQKQLGPDQRISMTADQRTDPSGDGSASSSATGNRQWTGVFDSWPASSDPRPNPTFRSWLISGDSTQLSKLTTADVAIPATTAIELVGTGTLGTATTGQIKVPSVTLKANGNTAGRVAWWIGDQGVKASLATALPSTDKTLAVMRNNLQSAPRNAFELSKVGAVIPFGSLAFDDPRLPRLSSWQQVAFVASDITAARPLFHDLAASSSGLLTNVRTGGFRKDLSLKMETYTGPPDLTKPENVLYTVKSQITNKDEVGINFMELWGYYQLYKDLNYGGGLNYTTGGVIPSGAPYLQTKRSEQEIADDLWDRFKHPITINYQTIYSFEVAPHPDEGGKNVLWLNFDPVVTLWNPLDVAVDIPKHATWNYLYSFWMIPYDINISINGGAKRACSILQTSNWKNDANFLKLNAGVVETITLKPGEVVKISQEGGTIVRNDRDQSVGGFQGFNGKKGFNYGGGYRVPLLDTSLQRIVVSASDRISYTATPRAGSEGSNSQRFSLTQVNLELGGRGATNHGYMSVDSRSNYARVQVGEVRTVNDQKTMPNLLDIKGNVHPEVYPSIEGPTMTREFNASALISDKATFMIHSYFVKTEEENLSGSKMFSRFNPRAYSLDFYDFSKQERDMLPFETKVSGLTSWLDAPLDESISGQGYFGSSLGAQFGSNFVTTHSVPRQPIVSLAALQNSFANGFNMATKAKVNGLVLKGSSASMAYPLLPQISHAIGNSLAPSVIPLDQTTNNRAGYPHPLADHSYLANRQLWDDYFLSGIAPQPQPAFATARDQKKVALDFFNNVKDLPVTRYRPELGGIDATKLVDSFFSGTIPTQESINKLASYLRVDGLFNVNSTSVEAWKALLGSLKNRPIVVRSESGVESIKAADGNTPVANGGAPRDLITSDDSVTDPGQWYGRRTLSDGEIQSLAEGIVKEVRKRGPFLSLADFVNRRVGKDKDLAKSGAIQSALDSPKVSINKKQNNDRAVDSLVANRFEFPEAEKGAMNYGAPSFVKQGDILTPIAPILSARSDSFIIRAYGEATDTKGNVLARAWCEAVVERSRDYVDTADAADKLPTDLIRKPNTFFGRRFNILLFRWLNSSEI